MTGRSSRTPNVGRIYDALLNDAEDRQAASELVAAIPDAATGARANREFLGQPAAILLVAVLHFIPGSEDPYRAVSFLKAAMAPGSYLVVSHGTGDNLDPGAVEKMQQIYAGARRRCRA